MINDCPHPKDEEGIVFIGVCLSTRGGGGSLDTSFLVSGHRCFLGKGCTLSWTCPEGREGIPFEAFRQGVPLPSSR